jgi:RNA polymerase-binding transcription factor DksA
MSAIDLDHFRQRLLAERERLDRQLGDIDRERHADGPIDALSGDAGQDTARVDTEMHLESDLTASLAEIDAALQRIEDGTYGLDEDTGEPINPERLEAIPTARRNIS